MTSTKPTRIRRLFTRLALLYLAGSLVAIGFRLINTSSHGAFILWASYSRSSELNTPEAYRYNNHGTIIAIKREVYEANIPWAIATLLVQGLCWLPASLLMCWEYARTRRLPLIGTLIIVLSFLVWLVSEVSSI